MKLSFLIFIVFILFFLFLLKLLTNDKDKDNKDNKDNKNNKDNKEDKYTKKRAICFLSASFSVKLYEFVEEMARDDCKKDYDFYICIDKDDKDYKDYKDDRDDRDDKDDKNITILFVHGKKAEEHGFKSSVLYFQDRACSRDKALYYFSIEKKDVYRDVWMIEDDVFFYDLESIKRLDRQYPDSDLLTKQFDIVLNHKEKDQMYWENWHFLENKIGFPWTKGMICSIRVSSSLLSIIRNYAIKNGTLLFDESMFTTLCLHSNLIIDTPNEFQEIDYYDHINWNNLNQTNFLHPVKDITFQKYLRQQLKESKK
jgi:hypothetical protein